jgi:hypothetical protein
MQSVPITTDVVSSNPEPPPIKLTTTIMDITEILLKVPLITIKPTKANHQWFEVKGDCLFSSYWLNCWQSLFKLSFHNVYDIATMYTLFTTWLADWFQISIPSTPSLPSSMIHVHVVVLNIYPQYTLLAQFYDTCTCCGFKYLSPVHPPCPVLWYMYMLWFQLSIPSTPSLPSSWYMYMLVLFKNQNLLP